MTVDDNGARHKGKNGYVTHIGNEFFGWSKSTSSKSRFNFLSERHRQIATEGALLGCVLKHGCCTDLVIVSDGARQFDVLLHALC